MQSSSIQKIKMIKTCVYFSLIANFHLKKIKRFTERLKLIHVLLGLALLTVNQSKISSSKKQLSRSIWLSAFKSDGYVEVTVNGFLIQSTQKKWLIHNASSANCFLLILSSNTMELLMIAEESFEPKEANNYDLKVCLTFELKIIHISWLQSIIEVSRISPNSIKFSVSIYSCASLISLQCRCHCTNKWTALILYDVTPTYLTQKNCNKKTLATC